MGYIYRGTHFPEWNEKSVSIRKMALLSNLNIKTLTSRMNAKKKLFIDDGRHRLTEPLEINDQDLVKSYTRYSYKLDRAANDKNIQISNPSFSHNWLKRRIV